MKLTDTYNKEKVRMLQQALEYLGLSDFVNAEYALERMASEPTMRILLYNDYKIPEHEFRTNFSFELLKDHVVEPLRDSIKNSPFMHDELYELEGLKTQVMELKSTVKKLEDYKTHYEMQYKMTHGKELAVIDPKDI